MVKAYLQITLTIKSVDRAGAAGIYSLYREPFLHTIAGALSNELLIHAEDIQILHGFDSLEHAKEYLMGDLFNDDMIASLKPYLKGKPNIKIYNVF